MSIAGLLIACVLTLLTLAFVLKPLLRPAREDRLSGGSLAMQRERLSSYYARVLTNIRDLDEDFTTGKIGPEDYRSEREVWVERGIRLLRVQDQLDLQQTEARTEPDAERIDRAIEAAVSAYREGTWSGVQAPAGEEEG